MEVKIRFLVMTPRGLVTEDEHYRETRCLPFESKPQMKAISSTETKATTYQTSERNQDEHDKKSVFL
jgi:hypothetical protein